jgi:hypothetical protein
MLDAAFITECEQRARRFAGAYTGTSGSLAAAVILLIKERQQLMATLEEANQALRDAVHQRLEGTPADDPKLVGWNPDQQSCCDGGKCQPQAAVDGWKKLTQASAEKYSADRSDWILQGQRELEESRQPRLLGDGVAAVQPAGVHPTSQAFYDLCDRLKEMHRLKSTDYGCPSGTDPLANIRNGAKFVGIPAWRAAMVRLSDKVTRLATFNATGSLSFEGVEDNLIDLASYALLSFLLYREDIRRP